MKKKNRRMPVISLIMLDVGLTIAGLGLYLLYDYVMPHAGGEGVVVAQIDSESTNTFSLPNRSEPVQESDEQPAETEYAHTTTKTTGEAQTGDNDSPATTTVTTAPAETETKRTTKNKYDNTGVDEYETDNISVSQVLNATVDSTEIGHYSNDEADITVYQKSIFEGKEKITYYVADVYVTNVGAIRTALAEDTYGKNIKESVSDMAGNNNAIWAVNGDFYGNSEEGLVVRNGVKYRDNLNDVDICVLYTDGSMETFPHSNFDMDEVMEKGVWQAWCFGPMLLDGNGNVLDSFNTTTYLNSANPRSAIGCVAPGHYVFMTVDGRDKGYSRGATMSELAALMAHEGCKVAYNLDGGMSALMYYDGDIINEPDRGGRSISDIIYVGR